MAAGNGHTVSWQDPDQWDQVGRHFNHLFSEKAGHDVSRVEKWARQIQDLYLELDWKMEALSTRVCPDCRDNCCVRAVIGYDFLDLLFLQLMEGKLPPAQIRKQVSSQGPVCACLTPVGCRLPRPRRPFVCTWYLCAPMKALDEKGTIQGMIQRLQSHRREMEAALYAVLQGKPVI